MTRAHVWGAGGYAGAEVVRLLRQHPHVELGVIESRGLAGRPVADHFPQLRTFARRFDAAGTVLSSVAAGDVVFASGGHGEAEQIVPGALDAGARVIDLSADYRFDAAAAYGLPEWYRSDIARSALIANPGCYPTAVALALLPLAGIAAPLAIAVDAKSGISGAGRKPAVDALFAEVCSEVRPYGLNGHRHQAEIERNLRAFGFDADVVFTPHVVPLARGMLVDVYAFLAEGLSPQFVAETYRQAYAQSPFVRVLSGDRVPNLRAVTGTNDAELRVDVNRRTVRAICAIDNLGKGAAGQAVQNLNIMLGLPEESGLHARAIGA